MSKIIIIIKTKPRFSLVLLVISTISVISRKKGKLLLRSLLSEGSLLSGFANTCEILLLLSGGRYFRNFTVVRRICENIKTSDPW